MGKIRLQGRGGTTGIKSLNKYMMNRLNREGNKMSNEKKDKCKDLIRLQDREQTLMECLSTAKSISEAGRMAGYSESYCRSNIYGLVKSDKFQEKLRKHYRTLTGALLPKILKAELALVDTILNDPEKLSRHINTIKQIKQASGVLEPDNTPKQPFIDIDSLQKLSLHLLNNPQPPEQENLIEVEITDVEE
jgi:hypothetical protein